MRENADTLPIDDVLDEIGEKLASGNRLVISAPPGAGKTTRVPPHLLNAPWTTGKRIVLIQPRRLAARAAAERMSASLGEKLGATIGLRTRMDVRTSPATRIEVVTDGVFTRTILADPALEDIACVIFDEFHERSLQTDEGMAFALDAQNVLSPDLRLIIMSATLPQGLTDNYFPAPVVESDGRMHAIETKYLGRAPKERVEDEVASAIRKALTEETGSILAFLPGAAEIRRTIERLEPPPPGVTLCPLFGALPPSEQSAAISPPPAGVRKVVIATDIAESALTIEGVRVVIDAGLARQPRYDASIGATRLETVRIARANADQRRGRAGRTQPGVCYRLWREPEMGGFAESPPAEIEQADLTSLCLDIATWGAKNASELQWLTPPKAASLAIARDVLIRLSALNEDNQITKLGKRIAQLPLSPQLALMVLTAPPGPAAETAALIAALLGERDLGGRSTDLADRIERLRKGQGQRERTMAQLAKKWASRAAGPAAANTTPSSLLAAAMPHRIARARPGDPGRYLLASGRGAFLDPTDPLCRNEWLIAADVVGATTDLRITLATPTSLSEIEAQGGVTTTETAAYDLDAKKVRARRRKSIGAIVFEDTPLAKPPPAIVRTAIIDAIRTHGFGILDKANLLARLIQRVEFLHQAIGSPWPQSFETELVNTLSDWLPEPAPSSLALDSSERDLSAAAQTRLDWERHRELDQLAPSEWQTPAGTTYLIDYSAPETPTVSCPIQQVYGLTTHPRIASDRTPLTLNLLSPASRPIAVTRNIAAFWEGGYADARKEMRSRYPKHFWPEAPAQEKASTRSIRRPGQ